MSNYLVDIQGILDDIFMYFSFESGRPVVLILFDVSLDIPCMKHV